MKLFKFETLILKSCTLLLCLVACKMQLDVPKELIQPDKMAQIIADIHIAEAKAARVNVSSYDSSLVVYQVLESRIFPKYKVDSVLYNRSYDFYASRPKYMISLYENIEKIVAEKKKKGSVD